MYIYNYIYNVHIQRSPLLILCQGALEMWQTFGSPRRLRLFGIVDTIDSLDCEHRQSA